MRAGERAPAQARVIEESILLDELADGAEPPVLELAHIEMPARCLVLRPSQKNIARRLHDMLPFDDAPAGMTVVLWPKAFEHRFSRFLDLKKQRRTLSAREQADRAERAHASDADRLEGHVPERVAVEQEPPLRRQRFLVS